MCVYVHVYVHVYEPRVLEGGVDGDANLGVLRPAVLRCLSENLAI